MHHHIGDIAVDEHLTWRQPGDLVCRNSAVGAADPQVLERLDLRELALTLTDAQTASEASPFARPGQRVFGLRWMHVPTLPA